MIDTDLCFEKSEVDATICTPVISIKNPRSGQIILPEASEIIQVYPDSRCEIIFSNSIAEVVRN
jgi:hypothetical protein